MNRFARSIVKHPKMLRLFGVTFIVMLGVAITMAILNAPSHGTIVANPKLSVKPRTVTQQVTVPDPVTNSFFRLQLPTGYLVQSSSTPPSGVLYTQTITKNSDLGRLIISIAIAPVPDGGLEAYPSYSLRVSQPQRYTLSTQTVNGQSVTVAVDTQSAAVVGFMVHAGHIAMISLTYGFDSTSPSGTTEEMSALQTILSAWQWQ